MNQFNNIMPESKRLLPFGMSIRPFVSRVFSIMEAWKDIPQYEGYYQASNTGLIRSVNRIVYLSGSSGKKRSLKGKLISQQTSISGYKTVRLSKYGIETAYLVSRLVGFTFVSNPHNKSFINHINGIKIDNRVENLEWVTKSENQKHAYDILGNGDGVKDMFAKDNSNFKGRLYKEELKKNAIEFAEWIGNNCKIIINSSGACIG